MYSIEHDSLTDGRRVCDGYAETLTEAALLAAEVHHDMRPCPGLSVHVHDLDKRQDLASIDPAMQKQWQGLDRDAIKALDQAERVWSARDEQQIASRFLLATVHAGHEATGYLAKHAEPMQRIFARAEQDPGRIDDAARLAVQHITEYERRKTVAIPHHYDLLLTAEREARARERERTRDAMELTFDRHA